MSKYSYVICGVRFNSKKAVLDYVRGNIFSKYKDFDFISGDHLSFMIGLLGYHPWGKQKIGVGVARMWLQPNGVYPTRSFWLERFDGSRTDFSFYQCVNPPDFLRDFKDACRRSVAPFVISFRRRFFDSCGGVAVCPVLGVRMTLYSSHVDHEPSFDFIVGEFIGVRGIDVSGVRLVEHGDGVVGCRFADVGFESDWVGFHNERAVLRVISGEANLRKG